MNHGTNPRSLSAPTGSGANGRKSAHRDDSTTAPAPPSEHVTIDGNAVVISRMEERDAEFVAIVAAASDPAEATHQCLRLGARAARAVQVTVDTALIERRFDDMQLRFDRQLTASVEAMSETTRHLLDADNGTLTVTLDRHRATLEALLGATFDPHSKRSVIALFDDVMRRSHEAQEVALRRLVSVDSDDGPLGRMKRDLTLEVRDQLREVKGDLKEISEKIAVTEAVAPVIALSTAHV